MSETKMPKRIQRKRTRGWRMPEGAVSVTRPSLLGNPFVVGSEMGVSGQQDDGLYYDCFTVTMTPENAVELFREDIHSAMVRDSDEPPDPRLAAIEALRGKDLACWCPLDQPCHADVLLEIANRAAGVSEHTEP